MSGLGQDFTIRRILVALDNSSDSLAALEAAVRLAASVQAEVVGLFVEDANLLRLAGLPFTREARFPSAGALDHSGMEQQLRLLAWQARRTLREAAEAHKVGWSFRVVRGQVTPEVLAAALDADLLTLGKASRPLTRRSRLGSTARAAATEAAGSVLLVESNSADHRPVVVLYDDTAAGKQALVAAAYLALAIQVSLVVLIPAVALDDHAQQLAEEARASLEGQPDDLLKGLATEYRRIAHADVARLVEAVRLEGGGALVLAGRGPLLRANAVQALLDELDCLLMLIR
jgi:nucleotide-binding universal stress UspA family protein